MDRHRRTPGGPAPECRRGHLTGHGRPPAPGCSPSTTADKRHYVNYPVGPRPGGLDEPQLAHDRYVGGYEGDWPRPPGGWARVPAQGFLNTPVIANPARPRGADSQRRTPGSSRTSPGWTPRGAGPPAGRGWAWRSSARRCGPTTARCGSRTPRRMPRTRGPGSSSGSRPPTPRRRRPERRQPRRWSGARPWSRTDRRPGRPLHCRFTAASRWSIMTG